MHKRININCKLFGVKIHVHILEDFKIIEDIYNIKLKYHDAKAIAVDRIVIDDEDIFLILFKAKDEKDILSRNIVHESVHIKNMIYNLVGIELDPDNDEFEAYFIDNLYNEILEQILKFSNDTELELIETYI